MLRQPEPKAAVLQRRDAIVAHLRTLLPGEAAMAQLERQLCGVRLYLQPHAHAVATRR
jgi:hypothetical protein